MDIRELLNGNYSVIGRLGKPGKMFVLWGGYREIKFSIKKIRASKKKQSSADISIIVLDFETIEFSVNSHFHPYNYFAKEEDYFEFLPDTIKRID